MRGSFSTRSGAKRPNCCGRFAEEIDQACNVILVAFLKDILSFYLSLPIISGLYEDRYAYTQLQFHQR